MFSFASPLEFKSNTGFINNIHLRTQEIVVDDRHMPGYLQNVLCSLTPGAIQ